MKKEFYMAIVTNDGKKLEKREGDYDAKYAVFYHKEDNGWTVTDAYTGTALTTGHATKKEAQDKVKAVSAKLNEIRNGEKFLQGVINYQELLEDETSLPF